MEKYRVLRCIKCTKCFRGHLCTICTNRPCKKQCSETAPLCYKIRHCDFFRNLILNCILKNVVKKMLIIRESGEIRRTLNRIKPNCCSCQSKPIWLILVRSYENIARSHNIIACFFAPPTFATVHLKQKHRQRMWNRKILSSYFVHGAKKLPILKYCKFYADKSQCLRW